MKKVLSIFVLGFLAFCVSLAGNVMTSEASGIWAGGIEGNLTMEQQGNTQDFTLTFKNQTPYVQKLQFGSGKEFDMVIKDKRGQVVYQYSSGKYFIQSLTERNLLQGEELKYDVTLDKLPKGNYTVEYWLNAIGFEQVYTQSIKVK